MAADSVMLLQVLVDPDLKIDDQLRQNFIHWFCDLRRYKYGERIPYLHKPVRDNTEKTSKYRSKGTSQELKTCQVKWAWQKKPCLVQYISSAMISNNVT